MSNCQSIHQANWLKMTLSCWRWNVLLPNGYALEYFKVKISCFSRMNNRSCSCFVYSFCLLFLLLFGNTNVRKLFLQLHRCRARGTWLKSASSCWKYKGRGLCSHKTSSLFFAFFHTEGLDTVLLRNDFLVEACWTLKWLDPIYLITNIWSWHM